MSTAIFTGRVILGPADAVIEPGAVLIGDDRRIAAVGHPSSIERLLDDNTDRYDLPAATAMPGMIDCHVHLAFDSSPTPFEVLSHADRATLLHSMAERARQLVSSGVTTARDLGDRDGLVATIRGHISHHNAPGPRLLTAGTPLTCPGGHCGFLGGEVSTPEEINHRIQLNVDAGVDLIKVMASGGALTPGGPKVWEAQFDSQQLRQIVATAARHNRSVAAHAHGTATIADCVDAGVATIEHCSWRTDSGLVYDPDTARRMAKAGVSVCRCVTGDWPLFLTQLGPNATPLIDSILSMRADGVRFIAGTDAGVPGARFSDYAGMLTFFTEIGFSTTEVLDMATTNAASALGLADTGSLQPGNRADLVVIDGDPLSSLETLRAPKMVVANGTFYWSQLLPET